MCAMIEKLRRCEFASGIGGAGDNMRAGDAQRERAKQPGGARPPLPVKPQLAAEILDGGPEALLERGARLPPEHLARPRDVGAALARVVFGHGFDASDGAAAADHAAHRLGEFDQRHLDRIAELYRARIALLQPQREPAAQIVYVT